MKKNIWLAALCAATLLTACSNLKEPATQVLGTAETSLAAIRDVAAQYAPADLQAVDTKIEALRKELASGNFKNVMAEAPALAESINKLSQTVDSKKADMMAAVEKAKEGWQSFSTDLPQMIGAIQSRVDVLSKSRKLPDNVTPVAFDSAKSGLDSLTTGWAEASSAFAAGDVPDAVAKAQAVKDQGAEILRALGMTGG